MGKLGGGGQICGCTKQGLKVMACSRMLLRVPGFDFFRLRHDSTGVAAESLSRVTKHRGDLAGILATVLWGRRTKKA